MGERGISTSKQPGVLRLVVDASPRYNPVVRCHAGKTAGFDLAERHLTFPADSANSVERGPDGSWTFNPGVADHRSSRLTSTAPLLV